LNGLLGRVAGGGSRPAGELAAEGTGTLVLVGGEQQRAVVAQDVDRAVGQLDLLAQVTEVRFTVARSVSAAVAAAPRRTGRR
jgi:hypothetical protein